MAHFYGTLQGNRGEASRLGTKDSGITTYAASWEGAVRVHIWNAQVAWNNKMRRLLAADGVIPVHPAPDYSLKALEAWAVSQSINADGSPNTWWRETHALLAKEPKSMRGFSFMPKGKVT